MLLTLATLPLLLLGLGLLLMLLPEKSLRAVAGGRDTSSVAMLPLALGLTLLGLLLAGMHVLDGVRAVQSRHWQRTPATITRSALVETMQPRSTTPAWRPDVAYAYTFAGQPYESHRLGFGAIASSDRAGTLAWLQQHYPVGHQVTAYVNPTSPALAVLEPGGSPWIWWMICIGMTLAGSGAWLLRTALQPPSPKRDQRGKR